MSFASPLWMYKHRKGLLAWEGMLLQKQLPRGNGGSGGYGHVSDFLPKQENVKRITCQREEYIKPKAVTSTK